MKFSLFSERQAISRGEYPPKPAKKTFPDQLRRNIATIFTETFGMYYDGELGIGHDPVMTTNLWIEFDRVMRRESEEYANFVETMRNYKANRRITAFAMSASDTALLNLLDLGIAVIVQMAEPLQREHSYNLSQWNVRLSTDDALAELDSRLRGAGTVYRIVDDALIISTDDVTHELALVPALQCLNDPGFVGAATEFHEALAAHRQGRHDQVLVKANHAFESTMTMRESAMKSLATLLEGDVPAMRNKTPSAGHGRGDRTEEIPESFATYVLTVTAANIRLLVDSYRAKRP
jgi:hypothetical protein